MHLHISLLSQIQLGLKASFQDFSLREIRFHMFILLELGTMILFRASLLSSELVHFLSLLQNLFCFLLDLRIQIHDMGFQMANVHILACLLPEILQKLILLVKLRFEFLNFSSHFCNFLRNLLRGLLHDLVQINERSNLLSFQAKSESTLGLVVMLPLLIHGTNDSSL